MRKSGVPSVDIIIPTYNSSAFLSDAITSSLRQTVPVHEIICVNDGSTDDTDSVLKPFLGSITYIRQANQGVSIARNAGLSVSRADYVVFLDADDRLVPNAVEFHLNALASNRHAAVSYGDFLSFRDNSDWTRIKSRPELAGKAPHPALTLFYGGGHTPSAFMVSSALAREVGGFDPQRSYAADIDFFMRCGALSDFVFVPHVVVEYRRHPSTMSLTDQRASIDVIDAKLSFLQWCKTRGMSFFDTIPSELDLFLERASTYYYAREWQYLRTILEEADRRNLRHPFFTRLRRMLKFPKFFFNLKDYVDTFLRDNLKLIPIRTP